MIDVKDFLALCLIFQVPFNGGGGGGGTYLQVMNNLSDVANVAISRSNLGLGSAATQNVAYFLQTANNLSDLNNAGTARTNLGLGSAATQNVAYFLQTANNLSDLNNITTAATNIGLLHGAVTYSDNVDHVLTAPLPAIISIGNTLTANFTLPVPSTINTNTLGNRIFINNYSTASQIFKNSAGTTIFTASPVTNYLLTLIDIGSNTWSASSIVGFVNSMAGDNVNVSLQSAYGVSGSPQIVGDMAFDDGSGTQFLISGSQIGLLNTVDQGVDNIFAELQFFGKTPSGNTFAGQFEPGFCKYTGGDSGFLNLVLLDNNVENRIFYAKGTSSTSGARIGLGNSSGVGNVSNVSINLGYGDTPNPNAIFQINSTTQGLQPPQMTTAQMNAIPVTPTDAGLTVYVIDGIEGEYICNGVGWDLTNGGGTSGDLQAAYDAGNTIALTTGLPVQISTQGSAINFVTYSDSTTSNGSDTLKGEQFTSSQNGFVTALQYADRHFTSGARQVGLYRSSDQVLLASALVDKSDPLDGTGNYRTHAITPVPITAGTNYFVVCIVPAGELWVFYAWSAPSPLTYTALTYQETTSTLSYPTMVISTPNLLYYGNQSLQFTPLSSSAYFNDSTQPALFSITSTTQGSLPWPLQSTSQFAALSLTKGLVAFDNVLNRPTVYDGSTIQTLAYRSDTPSVLGASSGGTGVSNSSNLTWTGGNNLTFTTSAATNVTLPSSGTLVASGTSVTFSGLQVTGLASVSSKGVFVDASGNFTLTGTLPVSQGGTGTGVPFTAGSVVFAGAGGGYAQDNANFFWDDTNDNLYLAANTSTTLDQAGRLVIEGTQHSVINGANIILYNTADSHPLYQLLGWAHDDIHLAFDCYWNGTNWISSYSSSNFRIYKHSGFHIDYAATAQGGTITWASALSIDTSGNITAGTITATLNGTATNATNVFINNNITTNSTYYIPFASTLNANDPLYTNANLIFNPNTNKLGTTSGGLTYEGNSFQGITSGNAQCIGLYGGNISFLTTPSTTDSNHGLGYYGSSYTKSWGGLTNVDGPVLFGFTGVVLGSSNGSVSVLHATKTQINLFDTNGSALSGINPALVFNSVLSQGNYINLGGNGRNIGVKTGGNHFSSYNLDYNTSGSYQYNASSTGCVLELTSGGGLSFLTAPSGTAGNSATTTTQFSVSNTGVINANGMTATGIVTVDGSHNLVSVAAESSYTPTLGDGTNNFSVTVAQGSYYKIGSLYHVQATITWTGKGSAVAASGLYITLPANVASGSSCSATVGYASGMSFTGSCLTSACGASTNFLAFYGISNTGTATQVLVSNASTSGQIFVSATFWSA